MGQPPFFLLRAPLLNAPLRKHGLEGKIEAATEHSEIISRPVDHAEAQIVSQTDVQGKSFNAHTKVAVEEIFYVGAAAPGVIASDVSVVGAEHWIAFTGTLYDIH